MITIKKFTPDEGLWVIVIVTGELKKHERHAHRSLVSFMIAPSLENEVERLGKKSDLIEYDPKKLRVVWTSIEHLPILIPGSVWTGVDEKADTCVYLPQKTFLTEVTYPKRPEFIDLGKAEYTDTKGVAHPYLPKDTYPLGQGLGAKAILFDSPSGKVIIPCSEILRAEYGSAPILLEAIVSGWFEDSTLIRNIINVGKTNEGIVERRQAGLSDRFIQFGKRVTSTSKRALAMLYNIHFTEFTRDRVTACYSAIKAAKPYNRKVQIAPPSHGKVQLGISGVRYTLKDGTKATFVLSIRSSTCSIAVKDFDWFIDNDNGQSENQPEPLTSAFPDLPTELRYEQTVEDDIHLSTEDASTRKSVTTVAIPGVIHSDQFDIRKIEKTEQKSENTKGKIPETPTTAVGQEKSKDGSPDTSLMDYQFDYSNQIINPRVPSNIENLVNALEKMLNSDSDFCKEIHCTPLKLGVSFLHRNIVLSRENPKKEVPIHISDLPKKINDVEYDFCNITINGISLARKILIVLMWYQGKRYALIEAEREEVIPGNDKTSLSSTYICRHVDRDNLKFKDINAIVASVCMNGPTLIPADALPMFVRKRLKHTEKDRKHNSSLPNRLKSAIIALSEEPRPKKLQGKIG
ncbi:hypothetical protein WH43_07490 [Rheinheimera sp. KL1]|uniref:hypothetical protein n=1 Tax=Rheinheimera sp. KL1 TaxID=1635005 RepID=UPI0006A9886B|nr:hypothetical protein [Rheinheimera sp. KL1]KOO58689.1 hypothetical protein WH43_07490 [Rheinheimera sp. KL1]